MSSDVGAAPMLLDLATAFGGGAAKTDVAYLDARVALVPAPSIWTRGTTKLGAVSDSTTTRQKSLRVVAWTTPTSSPGQEKVATCPTF